MERQKTVVSLKKKQKSLNLKLKKENNFKKQCEIFEIKHSKEISPAQYRHINNEEKIALTEAQFGKNVRKCVLYRGESKVLENGVEYKNVEEYLKGI